MRVNRYYIRWDSPYKNGSAHVKLRNHDSGQYTDGLQTNMYTSTVVDSHSGLIFSSAESSGHIHNSSFTQNLTH